MARSPWVIQDRKIQVAVVGCGRISKNHFQAIQQHNDFLTLAAVCDTDPKVLEQISGQYCVPGFLHIDDLLAATQVDLVVLCTPSGLHATQTIKSARSGCHVLTEKPMATRWADGINMVNACDEAGVRLFVVKQNRLNTTVQLLKRAIEQGRFGRIYLANVNVFWTRPQDYYDQSPWRGTWEFDGGAFMNQASHYVDLIHWLLGPVDSVQAMMATLARHIETEDTGVMNLRWRHGAVGSINVTMLTYPRNYEGSITILGEKGTVKIGGLAANEIQYWSFESQRPEDEVVQSANYEPSSVYGHGHPLYYENVVNTLRGQADPLVDGREGLASLELLTAAYRAARDKTTISLPLEL